jgi:TonB family protein
MLNFRKVILFGIFFCGQSWAQSGTALPLAKDSSQSTPQPSQPVPPSEKKSPSDQTPTASGPPDSTKLVAIKTEKAIYPYEAREQKLQGEVVVKILVSEEGDVESAEIASGNSILGKSAVNAVKKWKFKPFIKNGKPVKVSMKVPIDFAFSDKIMENGVSADRSTTSPQVSSGSSTPTPDPLTDSQGTPKRIRVSSSVSRGLLIRQVAPVYPDAARRAHIEGVVLLSATINKEGKIGDLQLISGPKELAMAAIGAVQQWRYKPYLLSGDPVEVETQIQVNFQLR